MNSGRIHKKQYPGGQKIKTMDISYIADNVRFNFRVCAVITDNNRLLAMHDEQSPYFYLPGGRVKTRETAEEAVLREVREELDIDAKIIRPLWVNQSFFNEDVQHQDFHEICIYFLIDTSDTSLSDRGDIFTLYDNGRKHVFEWIEYKRLKDEYLYPQFIKDEIFSLPDNLILRTERE